MIHITNNDLQVIDWDRYESKKKIIYCAVSYNPTTNKYFFRVRQEKGCRAKGSKIIEFNINTTDMDNLLAMCKLRFASYKE